MLTAIVRGHFYASDGALIDKIEMKGRTLTVERAGATNIRFWGKDMTELSRVRGGSGSYRLAEGELFVRAEIFEGGDRAYTQAFFPDRPHVTVTSEL